MAFNRHIRKENKRVQATYRKEFNEIIRVRIFNLSRTLILSIFVVLSFCRSTPWSCATPTLVTTIIWHVWNEGGRRLRTLTSSSDKRRGRRRRKRKGRNAPRVPGDHDAVDILVCTILLLVRALHLHFLSLCLVCKQSMSWSCITLCAPTVPYCIPSFC